MSNHAGSHLLQMRGLKLDYLKEKKRLKKSHLLQMRGLKPTTIGIPSYGLVSHLLQMRGLKPIVAISSALKPVASFTDAWIETISFQ